MDRVVRPKNQRVKRALEHREPKINENTRIALLIKGSKTNERVSGVLHDLHRLKKPNSLLLSRHHEIRPFENAVPLETLARKYDTSLCAFVSHSKKRPHNLTLISLFDHHVFDMFELSVDNFKALRSFQVQKAMEGCKPCLLFAGEIFQHDPLYQRLKSLLISFFCGQDLSKVALEGVEHVIAFTAADGKIFVRSYRVMLRKSGTKLPRVELVDMGPHLDLQMGRSRLAESDLMKQACKQPKVNKPKKVKNVSYDAFGTKMARIHMQPQDLDQLQTRKTKALKRSKSSDSDETSPRKRKKR